MQLLIVSIVIAIFALGGTLWAVWRAALRGTTSIATAIATTCILFGMLLFVAEIFFVPQNANIKGLSFIEPTLFLLLFTTAISGAIGMVCDRQIANRQSTSRKTDAGGK